MDCSVPGSSVYGIIQARIMEWVAFPFSSGSSQFWDQTQVSCIGWQILYGRDTSALGTHLVLFFTLPRKGGASPYTFQEGDEGDVSSVPGSGRSPGEGNGSPLQYSCLGNPMDRGAWWATVHGAAKVSDMT